MRVLITGASGMLGHKLYQRLSDTFDVFGTIRSPFKEIEKYGIFDRRSIFEDVDLAQDSDITRAIELARPDVVVNAAGIIKQIPSSEDIVASLSINSILPHKLAELGQQHGFRTILISTDCVFSGTKGNYAEDDEADAHDIYGLSKKLGEVTSDHCINLRTSFIGRELRTKHSLLEWFLSNRHGNVKGFTHAIYSGFPTLIFADIIKTLILDFSNLSGTYHVSSDPIDKFTLLELINDVFDADVAIEPDSSVVIDRSLNSQRFRQKTCFEPLSWQRMIEMMAGDRTPYASFN